MSFALHPRLEADTASVATLDLCRVLLMNDARFPWLVLVPRRPGLRDFDDLEDKDRAGVVESIVACSRALKAVHKPDKINVAALGNQVPQLHVHVIARFHADAAWPRPVWGVGTAVPYAPECLAAEVTRLSAAIAAASRS